MTQASDTYVTGTVVAASLLPQAVDSCDPWLRRLLIGPQFFVKLSDGRWCPQGCQLGRACCFEYSDLREPIQHDGVPHRARRH
jgi:hypothetical protein